MSEKEVLELLHNMHNNFSISDIIAMGSVLLGAVIAVVSACSAHKSKRESEENNKKAQLYATNADLANQTAKRYYEKWLEDFDARDIQNESVERKNKIVLSCKDKEVRLSDLSTELDITCEETRALLDELQYLDDYKVYYQIKVKVIANSPIWFGSISFTRSSGEVILPKDYGESSKEVLNYLNKGLIKRVEDEPYISIEKQSHR